MKLEEARDYVIALVNMGIKVECYISDSPYSIIEGGYTCVKDYIAKYDPKTEQFIDIEGITWNYVMPVNKPNKQE